MSDLDDDIEPPRKGRTTAMVTFEALAGIREGLQRAIMGIERMDEKFTEERSSTRDTLNDHEARIRILEAARTTTSGAVSAADWVYKAFFPLATLGMGLLVYFSK